MTQNEVVAIEERRAKVAKMYLEGKTQAIIAVEVNVSQGTISTDMAAIREMWRTSTVMDFNEQKIETLKKIDKLEAQAWDDYFASKEKKRRWSTKRRTTVGKDKDGKPEEQPESVERYTYSEERDPAFQLLSVIDRCIERRCRLLGLDAPLKIAETDTEGKLLEARRVWILKDATGGTTPPAPDDV